jgi:hypothetical protein
MALPPNCFLICFTREEDKYGLTDLSALKQVGPGVFRVGELLLFAHRYFRRSQSHHNNSNADFLSILGRMSADKSLVVKIAIDPDVVGLAGTWKSFFELQYWWGPKFNDHLPDVTSGVTRHEADERLKFFHGISRTEFWWHNQSDIQTFEAEEVRDTPTLGISSEHYACRYVHSMLEHSGSMPDHLDGAVRIYETEQFLERIDLDIARAGRHADYLKLWRIDGPMAVERWKELLCHFYLDNTLVGEYLGGEDAARVTRSDGSPLRPRELAAYLPRFIEPDEGVYALVSYHARALDSDRPVEIRFNDQSRIGGQVQHYVELGSIDFLKMLSRSHSVVSRPATCKVIAFEDTDINIPLVIHRGADAVALAHRSLNCLRDFVSELVKHGCERFITAEFAVVYADKTVKFSFAACQRDLGVILSRLPAFPDSAGVADWCTRTHGLMRSSFPHAKFQFDQLELVKACGALRAARQPAKINRVFEHDGKGLVVEIPCEEMLAKAIAERKITIAPYYDVKSAVCSRCKSDYLACQCAALFDAEVRIDMRDVDLLGYFWTTRPSGPRAEIMIAEQTESD